MGKNKKPFIDKKNASTYHLLHRSQRDVAGGDDTDGNQSGVILWPSPDNRHETDAKVLVDDHPSVMGHWKSKMSEVGIVEDYNYDQHLKPITGTGTFLDPQGHAKNALLDPRAKLLELDVPKEVSRQLESIALTPDCMDDDVAQALFGDFDDGDFEEILDDFCITAAQEPEGDQDEEFDYDAHIRALMERAASQERDEGGMDLHQHDWGKNDHVFFSKAKPLHEQDDDDDDDDDDEDGSGYYNMEEFTTPGVLPALNPEEERALCEKFEQTLLEYDSDEVGDLDEECEEIRGTRPLEGDALIEAALEEFLLEKKDDIFMEGTRHLPEKRRQGGSSFAALVGKNMVPAADLNNDPTRLEVHDAPVPVEEILAGAYQILANPEMEPPPEEILIDGKSYFSERTRNPWDCESILTTYSNLDNNPVTIGNRRRDKKKSKRVMPQTLPEDEPVQIQLSNKTGLPIGIFQSPSHYDEEDDTFMSVNRGEARNKEETIEEKKARKAAVKKEREAARIQKKVMKEAFRDEFMKRTGDVITDDVGGKAVFRYS